MINFSFKKTGSNAAIRVDPTYSRNFKIARINLERNLVEEKSRKSFRSLELLLSVASCR